MKSRRVNSWVVGLGCVLVCLAFLWGCSHKKETEEDQFFKKWQARAEKFVGSSPSRSDTPKTPEEMGVKSFPEQRISSDKIDRPLPTQKITIALRDIDIVTVLRAVAKAIDQNILINSKIEGTVSVEVENVPWDKVFLGILKTNGLTYAWEGDIIRVMTIDDMQREIKRDLHTSIIPIEYADAESLRANINTILTEMVAGEQGAGVSGDQTQAAGQDQKAIKAGSVMVDKHTNSLVIQANRDDINRLIPMIKALDKPTQQVLIEAHIVEANKETARELGIQWGGLGMGGDYILYGNRGPFNTTGGSPEPGIGIDFPADVAAGKQVNLGLLLGDLSGDFLAVQLTALEEDQKINILSSPSITTLDHQEATIKSGEEVPFQTVDANGNINVEWKEATLELKVKPHIIDGNWLKLEIITKKDELDFNRTVLGNPTIITKNAETTVVLKNGQTTVIGGLTKRTGSEGDAGVPGVKNVPGLGYLFKTESKGKKMEDVLIFITPKILRNGNDCPTPENVAVQSNLRR